MKILELIIKIASFLTAVTVIINSFKKIINNSLNILKDSIKYLDITQSQNYLVDFLSDIENGIHKNECQIKRAFETYDHYIELGGNSYIKEKWQKFVKEDLNEH